MGAGLVLRGHCFVLLKITAVSATLNTVPTPPTHLPTLQLVFLTLLVAIALLAGIARKLSVSYPIVLVVAGLLSSFIPGIPRVPLPPDLVFLIFLPPLLFAAAWQTSWLDFKYNIISITSLAVGLVFFTAIGVALTAHFFIPSFDWRVGFLLGAIVSPTDAVAASSVAKKIGLPKRIIDLLEGESLLNDATGLLALQFGLNMLVNGTTPTVWDGALRLLWLFAGGVGVGLLFAVAVVWFEKWIDDGPVEIAMSFIVAYGAYLAGEAVHSSGVISVVACGLYLSRKSATFFSPEVRLQANAVWEAVEFLLNGLVFLLIGLQLSVVLSGIREYSHARLFLYGLVFSLVLIVLRLVWMYPAAKAAHFLRTHLQHQNEPGPQVRGVFMLGWTGMRGVVALAAASSLPYTLGNGQPFAQRNMIVFLTFCVILVTLVVQGITLPAVVNLLKLNGGAQQDGCDEGEARRKLLRRALEYLQSCRTTDEPNLQHAYDDLLHQYGHRLDSIVDCGPGLPAEDRHARTMANVMLETVRIEREELIGMRESGQVDDRIYRLLERELDLSESRFASGL
ncbi:MAG: Na+/H+ antiporter [Janthinobacterium lividum]